MPDPRCSTCRGSFVEKVCLHPHTTTHPFPNFNFVCRWMTRRMTLVILPTQMTSLPYKLISSLLWVRNSILFDPLSIAWVLIHPATSTSLELLNPIGASRYRHFTTPPRDTSGSPRSVHTSSLHFAFDGITPRRPDILRGTETGDEQQSTNTSRRLPEYAR